MECMGVGGEIDEDLRRLIDEVWREVIWVMSARKEKLLKEACNGREEG
jgi:hypothetical protein